MKISEQIKDIVKHNNSTITDLASLMNTSQANLANKLIRDNFKLSDVKQILDALGYSHIEIVARGNNETVVISDNDVRFVENNIYMVFDENASLMEDIQQNGFRDRKFKDLAFDLVEPILKPKFGDLWNVHIPKGFEEGFKAAVVNQISFDDFYDDLITLKTSVSSNEKEDK